MDVVTGGEDKRVLRWDRPDLPQRYQGAGIMLGGLCMCGALLLAAIPFLASGNYGAGGVAALLMLLWPPAGAMLIIGMWITSVCLILREIRLQAFEAAIRGGDLTDVTAPKREKAAA